MTVQMIESKINWIQNVERFGFDCGCRGANERIGDGAWLKQDERSARSTAWSTPRAFLRHSSCNEKPGKRQAVCCRRKCTEHSLLSTLLQDDKLDFFLLCSSLRAFTGRAGAAAYSAANSFLGAFAQAKSQIRAIDDAIDWDGWIDVGMSQAAAVGRETSSAELGMSAEEGVETLQRILWRRYRK